MVVRSVWHCPTILVRLGPVLALSLVEDHQGSEVDNSAARKIKRGAKVGH